MKGKVVSTSSILVPIIRWTTMFDNRVQSWSDLHTTHQKRGVNLVDQSDALAGASQPDGKNPVPDTAQEVFPVQFEKDYLDYTGTLAEDEPVVPKASSAPVSASTQESVTGLEDLSSDDLEKNVPSNAEKEKKSQSTNG